MPIGECKNLEVTLPKPRKESYVFPGKVTNEINTGFDEKSLEYFFTLCINRKAPVTVKLVNSEDDIIDSRDSDYNIITLLGRGFKDKDSFLEGSAELTSKYLHSNIYYCISIADGPPVFVLTKGRAHQQQGQQPCLLTSSSFFLPSSNVSSDETGKSSSQPSLDNNQSQEQSLGH